MIKAEVHSDDNIAKAEFDATPWFRQATDAEILALAASGWGGDYEADAIAEFSNNRKVRKVFDYLNLVRGTDRECGFECHVVLEDACRWIAKNRCHLLDKLEG